MTKKTAKSEWNSWEVVPENGAAIIVKMNTNNSEHSAVIDYADGTVWAIFDGEDVEDARIYDLPAVWKLKPAAPVSNETKPATTEPDKTKSRRFSLNISDDDLHRYISAGLKSDSGVTIENMWTNADEGFIVYGWGLGKVQS